MNEIRDVAKERYKKWNDRTAGERTTTLQALEQHRLNSAEGIRSENKSRSQEVSQVTKQIGKEVSNNLSCARTAC